MTDIDEKTLDHESFAALLPSQQRKILDLVAARSPFPCKVITFTHCPVAKRTYAAVYRDRWLDDYVTYLVAFGEQVRFVNGHYGFKYDQAIRDMHRRAHG